MDNWTPFQITKTNHLYSSVFILNDIHSLTPWISVDDELIVWVACFDAVDSERDVINLLEDNRFMLHTHCQCLLCST